MTMPGSIVLENCKSRRILLPGEEEQPHGDSLTDPCSVSRYLLCINSPLVEESSCLHRKCLCSSPGGYQTGCVVG